MSVLFSRLANNESYIDKPAEVSSGMTYAFNCTFFVDEYYNATAEEYDGYLIDGLKNAHIGLECDNPTIVVESLTDVMHNIIQWFKKWLIKFKNFIVKCIKRLWDFFTKGDDVVRKFEGKFVDFKPFTVKGYRYTISPNDMNYQLYSDFINTVNSAAFDIAYATTDSSLNAAVSKTKDVFGSPEFLDMFRGKMLNCEALDARKFKKNLKRLLRNGEEDKINVDVNPSSIQTMCTKFKMFKECIESCKRNQTLLEKNTEILIGWMEGSGSYVASLVPRDGTKGNKEIRRKKISAIFNIYNGAALAAKQIQHIYDTYYMTKIDVLNEAMTFYLKVIRTAFTEGKAKV